MFRKVLVANRGEIAVRVIRALRERRIPSVAVYSDVDRTSLAVRMADEAVHIGPAASSESYLRADKIIAAALERGADAIHPGYGFLSENADFADACVAAGLIFIGPSGFAIRAMGSKTAARRIAALAGAPIVPGTSEPLRSLEEAREIAERIGYGVMLKASAGGGGKGMRRVNSEAELAGALRDATSEAERSFKSSEVYIEKIIERPRHIEIQILADQHGNMVHLGERECSIQRRHQKVIEECPSPLVAATPGMREKMGEAALRIVRATNYVNAGTIEFLADDSGNFYFLEMNTRLQVEHPVTELATGLDLVDWQLRIASGEALGFTQSDVAWRGSAIECRIYAEDPDMGFLPSPGRIEQLSMPSGPGIRLDSGVYPGWTVPMDYDPLLAKLAVWGDTREAAIRRLDRALSECSVFGIKTNIAFFRAILQDSAFADAQLHTGFIEEFMKRVSAQEPDPSIEEVAALAAAWHSRKPTPAPVAVENGASPGRWLASNRERLYR